MKFKLKVDNIVVIVNTSFCSLLSQTLHQLIPLKPTHSYMVITMSPVTTIKTPGTLSLKVVMCLNHLPVSSPVD